jgi:nucleoside-diphosphate-sugar epimerase
LFYFCAIWTLGVILITGGTGFTGSFVVHEMVRRSVAVRLLRRPSTIAHEAITGVETADGDLSRPDSLKLAAKGVRGIIHAACTFVDAPVDIAAMEALLDAWEEGPFVYLSSLDVYGYPNAVPVTEERVRDGAISTYARGKITCEVMLEDCARARGRDDFTILRASYIFGPHQRSADRLINHRLRQGLPIVLPGGSRTEWSNYRDAWIDVRDLAWIVAECVARPLGRAVNALNGHFVWHELYRALAHKISSPSTIEHKDFALITDEELPNKRLYAQTWYFSNTLLRMCLGFQPRYTLPETLDAVATTHAASWPTAWQEGRNRNSAKEPVVSTMA